MTATTQSAPVHERLRAPQAVTKLLNQAGIPLPYTIVAHLSVEREDGMYYASCEQFDEILLANKNLPDLQMAFVEALQAVCKNRYGFNVSVLPPLVPANMEERLYVKEWVIVFPSKPELFEPSDP